MSPDASNIPPADASQISKCGWPLGPGRGYNRPLAIEESFMHARISVALTLAVFLAAPASAQDEAENGSPPVIGDCAPPASVPAIPDGSTAPASEIKAAVALGQAYVADGEAYAGCLLDHEEALEDAGEEITPEVDAEISDAHNAMVDSMKALADEMNGSIRAYKARRQAEKDAAAAAAE